MTSFRIVQVIVLTLRRSTAAMIDVCHNFHFFQICRPLTGKRAPSPFAQCIASAARAGFKNVLQMTTFNIKYFTSFDVAYYTWMIYKPIHIKNLFRAFVLKQITFTIHLKTGRFFFFFFGQYIWVYGDIYVPMARIILLPVSKVSYISIISNSWSHWTDRSSFTYWLMRQGDRNLSQHLRSHDQYSRHIVIW